MPRFRTVALLAAALFVLLIGAALLAGAAAFFFALVGYMVGGLGAAALAAEFERNRNS